MKYKNKYTKREQVEIFVKRLNKANITDSHITYRQAKKIFEEFLDMYTDIFVDLEVGEKININNFMTVVKEKRDAKMGRNPKKPNDEYLISGHEMLKIKQSENLKTKIREKNPKYKNC